LAVLSVSKITEEVMNSHERGRPYEQKNQIRQWGDIDPDTKISEFMFAKCSVPLHT